MRKWITPVLALAFFAGVGGGCGREQASETVDGVGLGEADRMVVELFTENRGLKERVNELTGEVEALQRQLAGAMAQVDVARMAAGRSEDPPMVSAGPPVDDIALVRVLDVNREMKVAVVNGGVRAGMKNGMRFHVLRGEQVVAQMRLIDVRDTIAGGLIEEAVKDGFPEVGDRLILSSKQDR